MIIYISGAPGVGKSLLVNEFKKNGFKIFGELVTSFPKDEFLNPRSFETAEYIFGENVVRDKLLRQATGIVIVDRHPKECLIIAKGLIESDSDFQKIKKMYDDYDFLKGKIIRLIVSNDISKNRYMSKKIEIINEEMISDIQESFKNYSDYLSADLEVESNNSVEIIYSIAKKQIKNWGEE